MRRLSFRFPPRKVPAISRQKLTNWLRMVAQAAPATPMSKTKMNKGSSPTLSTAPKVMPIIE